MREAERECEEALEDIRIRLQANRVDVSLLSQEGWTMVLLRSIKNNGDFENDFGSIVIDGQNFRNTNVTHFKKWK